MAAELGATRVLAYGDSQLVISQVQKDYECHDDTMTAYCNEVRKIESRFEGLELQHVPRKDNTEADELARLGSARSPAPPCTLTHRFVMGVQIIQLTKPYFFQQVH